MRSISVILITIINNLKKNLFDHYISQTIINIIETINTNDIKIWKLNIIFVTTKFIVKQKKKTTKISFVDIIEFIKIRDNNRTTKLIFVNFFDNNDCDIFFENLDIATKIIIFFLNLIKFFDDDLIKICCVTTWSKKIYSWAIQLFKLFEHFLKSKYWNRRAWQSWWQRHHWNRHEKY